MKHNFKKICLTFALLITTVSIVSTSFGAIEFSRNMSASGLIGYSPQTSVNVYANNVIGLNSLALGFQLDGRDISAFRTSTTLQNLAEQANFKMVRFFHHRHGWAVTNWDDNTQTGTWSWSRYDQLVNAIVGIGAEPLVCLGYGGSGSMSLPSGMDRWSEDSYFPDPDSFAAYAREWVRHFKGKVKYWEILNEPYQHYYWTDSTKLARYCTFWNTVARAMRQEDQTILISQDGSTVKHALDYWINNGDDLDFLGFHKYDSSTRNPATDAELFARAESERVTDYGGTQNNWRNYGVQEAKAKWRNARGETLPVICGEANINWAFDPTDIRIQTMVGATWAAITIRYQMLVGLDYWLWWDFAGRGSSETRFGMVNLDNNQPWYPYYAMQMIGSNLDVGDQIVETTSPLNDVRALAWIHNSDLKILLIHKSPGSQTFQLSGVTGQLDYSKIDDSSPNLQTGTVSASKDITMNGYTVMLLSGEGEGAPPPSPSEHWNLNIGSTEGGRTSPSGSVKILEGNAISVNAEAESGWEFSYWQFDGENLGNANPVTIPAQDVDTQHNLIAVFSKFSSANVMHVERIDLARYGSRYVRCRAVVTIVDSTGSPVAGATVEGIWGGLIGREQSRITGTDGKVTFDTYRIRRSRGTITFAVNNVVKTGWTYNPLANEETSDTITL